MPGFDGTGPMGKGPGTGGERGFSTAGPGANSYSGFYRPCGYAYRNYRQGVYLYDPGVVYGVGRGGFPRGCGRGRTFGGRRWR